MTDARFGLIVAVYCGPAANPVNVHRQATAVVSDPDERQRGIANGPGARSVGHLDSRPMGARRRRDRRRRLPSTAARSTSSMMWTSTLTPCSRCCWTPTTSVVESGVHAVGVTWTPDGETIAARRSSRRSGARACRTPSPSRRSRPPRRWPSGIADIAGYDDVAVCVFEPDATLVAVVNADGVTVEPPGSAVDGRPRVGRQRDRAGPQRPPARRDLRRRFRRPRSGRVVDGHGRGGTGDLLDRGRYGHVAWRGGGVGHGGELNGRRG